MNISKAIKGIPRKVALDYQDKPETFLSKISQVIATAFKRYIYYPVDSFISRTHERASRSLAFAKHGWMHYDFESAYLYDIMAFKMKRIYKCIKNGQAIQDDKDMKALKEAIAICERLFNGEYNYKYYKAHDKKWGKMNTVHIPEYDENGNIKHYCWENSRPKAKTDKQKEKEVADLRQIYVNEEIDRKADIDRLAEILKNHEPSWWY
jgi:hypothetical protein